MDNPFVGFETFTKQRTDDEHPYGEDSHLDDDSILERHGDVETGDDYEDVPLYEREDPYPPNKLELTDEDIDDIDLQWGKVSDAAKGAVGAAKSGAASAAKTARTAGKAAAATGMDAAKTAGTAIGAAGQQAAKTAQSAGQAAGATVGQAAQTAGGFAQDAASTGIAAGQKAAATGMDAAKTAGTAIGAAGQQAGAAIGAAGQKAVATGQKTGQVAGATIGGAFGKSHDDMMSSLDQAIGFMEKQVDDTDEEAFYDEPTTSRTAVRSVERGDEDTLFDAPESIEDFDYDDPTQLNTAQREADQKVARNRQQGIAANKKYEAERAVPSSREQDQGQYPEANDFPSPEAGLSPSHFSEEELLGVPEGRKRRRVSTPENISTSARENRLEEENRKLRRDKRTATTAQRNKVKTERESVPLTPMERPYRPSKSEQAIEDDVSQSADSVLAKALGSVIGIMEKQDPKFRCQECGTKVPKGGRKCRKCGSEDIDLG